MKNLTVLSFLAIFFYIFPESTIANASGYNECGIFSTEDWRSERGYQDCFSCLRDNDWCEERCWQEGYRCEAVGTYGLRKERITGPVAPTSRQAEQLALSRCYDAGLADCSLRYCDMDDGIEPSSVRPCDRSYGREPRQSPQYGYGQRPEYKPRPTPRTKPDYKPRKAPGAKVVVSWQHVKGECLAKPYKKIAEQCGNRTNYWQGIYCVVHWSDGTTSEVHGKIDLRDSAGQAYCTSSTRPLQFNCVNRCDNNNGPVSRP